MQNLFVSYELALKLKEKGFNERCLGWYEVIRPNYLDIPYERNGKFYISEVSNRNLAQGVVAPLYQQVIDWFREVHGLYIYMKPDRPNNIGDIEYVIETLYDNQLFLSEIHMDFGLARNAAIEKALTLI